MFASFSARAVGLMGLSAEETVDLAAGAGFAGVDLLVRDLVRDGVDPAALRSRMDDLGLRGGAFPCPVYWRAGDDAAFRRDLDGLGPVLDAAATLGLTRTGTWVLPAMPDWSSDRAEVADWHLRRLGALARRLGAHGIQLGLEVIGVESSRPSGAEPFVARLGDLDEALGAIWVEAPNLGLLLDAFHLFAAGESIETGLARGVDRIAWAHVADLPPEARADRARIIDAERGLPGENGAVNARAFLARLAVEGFEGPVTAEPLARCRSLAGLDPAGVAARVKASLDQSWPA